MQKQKHADFAIITILEEELEAVVRHFPLDPQFWRGPSNRSYGISRVQTKDGKDCVVAIARASEQGPLEAQRLASDMISDLSPSLILVVGIAGGVPDMDFSLGDVIVSSRIHDFSMNAYNPGHISWNVQGGIHSDVGEIVASLPLRNPLLSGWNTLDSIGIVRPALDGTVFKNFSLSQLTEEEKSDLFVGAPPLNWQRQIMESLKKHFGNVGSSSGHPLYKIRNIASSGSLIHDTKILLQWLESAQSIRALEMEAGGVFLAARQLGKKDYPVIAIRGISDIVGLRSEDEWTAYACHSAAAFTHAFLSADSTLFDNIWRLKPAEIAPPSKSPGVEPDDGLIKLYIIYAAEDEAYKDELRKHLVMLRRQKVISTYNTHQVSKEEVNTEIDPLIDKAQIVLLLISPDFMASELTYDYEMARAMERRAAGENVRVIPILLRDTDWENTPMHGLQALPRDKKPIAARRSPEQDAAWTEIAREIRGMYDPSHK